MKYFLLGLLTFQVRLFVFSQKDNNHGSHDKYVWSRTQAAQNSSDKPAIDTCDFRKWSFIGQPLLSNDGRFASYYISDRASGDIIRIVKSVETSWKKEIINGEVYNVQFSENSKLFIYELMDNQLCLLTLGTEQQEIIPGVKSYSLFKRNACEWLAYQKTNSDLVLRNLKDNANQTYTGIDQYLMSKDGRLLILKIKLSDTTYVVKEVNLDSKISKDIYKGTEPFNLLLDNKGKQLIFITQNQQKGDIIEKAVWYYNRGRSAAAVQMTPEYFIDKDMELSAVNQFNDEGSFVICDFTRKGSELKNEYKVKMNIRSYTDSRLESSESENNRLYIAVWHLQNNTIRQIEHEGEFATYLSPNVPLYSLRSSLRPNPNNTMWLLASVRGHSGEWNWNENAIPRRTLVNLLDNTRKQITEPNDHNGDSYILSPSGKWIVYFDGKLQAYFSYNVATGERNNITSGVSAIWTEYDKDDWPIAKYSSIGIGGFNADETKIYIYSQHDIFLADLSGKSPSLNLTDGYGAANNIVFRFAFSPGEWNNENILLTAFNRTTKEDGYFEIKKDKLHSLRKLTMEPAVFSWPEESRYMSPAMPIKAKNANVYLVQKMDASNAPNFYITKDFIRFKAISDVHPEKRFNWLTTELVNFKTRDGKDVQGILYKPGNFDPQKKYPVIFYYYEKISECLNNCIQPGESTGPINIPYFVSNGYLVFTPDIHFQIGYPGRSSFNTVMGAADKLCKLPFVDSTRMGLQGHSFGGFQTNYIITQTNRFAAACSASGFTNFVSAYGSIIGPGYSRQGQYELYRDRIGATLWERPDLYLENSPVMWIDKINTPLLMMHNMEDDDVPVTQGIEFFTGLRRLGKIAYLLQYDGEGHSVLGREAAKDYSKRMLEFFDYYLKGTSLPGWMTDKPAKILDFNPLK